MTTTHEELMGACRQWISGNIGERSEYLNNDLAELERILYVWALSKGYADGPFTCKGCGREESICSADPCPDVIADREATYSPVDADRTDKVKLALFRQRLDEFATAASLLNGAWNELDTEESKGYPFAKDFESVVLDIIRWNQAQPKESN